MTYPYDCDHLTCSRLPVVEVRGAAFSGLRFIRPMCTQHALGALLEPQYGLAHSPIVDLRAVNEWLPVSD